MNLRLTPVVRSRECGSGERGAGSGEHVSEGNWSPMLESRKYFRRWDLQLIPPGLVAQLRFSYVLYNGRTIPSATGMAVNRKIEDRKETERLATAVRQEEGNPVTKCRPVLWRKEHEFNGWDKTGRNRDKWDKRGTKCSKNGTKCANNGTEWDRFFLLFLRWLSTPKSVNPRFLRGFLLGIHILWYK